MDCWVVKCAIRLWARSVSSWLWCQPIPAQLHLHFLLGFFFFSPHPLLAHVSYLDLLYFSSKGVAINRRTSSLESTSIGLNCVLRPLFALGSFQPVEIPFIFPHSIWLVMSDALSSLFQMSLRLWDAVVFLYAQSCLGCACFWLVISFICLCIALY